MKEELSDITEYKDHKYDKKNCTHHGFLVNSMSNNTRTIEHIFSRTGGEAHFFLSGTRILVGAVLSREFALWSTCIWRNVAKISRGEGCYESTLNVKKNIMMFVLQTYLYMPMCTCMYIERKVFGINCGYCMIK